jgi:hypothetical protein
MQHVFGESRQKSGCAAKQYRKQVERNGTQYHFSPPNESQALEEGGPGCRTAIGRNTPGLDR